MPLLVVGVYAVAMWYGVLSLGLAYLFDETRGVPPLLLLAGAVLLPGAAAFGVPFVMAAAARGLTTLGSLSALGLFLALPAALAFLFARAAGAEAYGADYLRRRRERAHADADRVLAENPDDLFALLHKAKTFEEEAAYESALKAYERVHALSEKMVTVYALADHRRRLTMLIETRDADAARKALWTSRLADARVESVLLGLGLLMLFFAWPLGLQLTVYMAFVRWFHSETRRSA